MRATWGTFGSFLAEKHLEGCGGLKLTDVIRVTIAAQACLLLLHRETEYYPRLVTILVYPSAYVARSIEPIGGGFVLEGEVGLLGEAQKRPAWSSCRGTTCGPGPPISTMGRTSSCTSSRISSTRRTGLPMVRRSWSNGASTSPGHGCSGRNTPSCARIRRAGGARSSTKYGATNPAEFFAVATECFFEKPGAMMKKHPGRYTRPLKAYYHQDPHRWQRAGRES